jgi:hypothetical protein
VIVDQLIPPEQRGRCEGFFLCGPYAWGYAGTYAASLERLAADQIANDAAEHPCPPTVESQEEGTVDGEPAILMSKHCPEDDGILNVTAVVIKDGVGFRFYMQDPSKDANSEALTATEFATLLGTIALP